jgi:hypothetical protein
MPPNSNILLKKGEKLYKMRGDYANTLRKKKNNKATDYKSLRKPVIRQAYSIPKKSRYNSAGYTSNQTEPCIE